MEKGLNAFWKWMEKKGYGIIHNLNNGAEYGLLVKSQAFYKDNIWDFEKQMLIGFMIEYLFYVGIADALDIFSEATSNDINSIYEYLEDMIKDIPK